MKVEIDKYSGFCFGVTNAIKKAEEHLADNNSLFCLGHIVHNKAEENRLENLGLKSILHDEYKLLKKKSVLIRAHGEPPTTYKIASDNELDIIDATCPVVLNLQKKIKETAKEYPNANIIIFGKKGHAEVNGLVGQTNGKAQVISDLKDADFININVKTYIFAQTTANLSKYKELIKYLKNKAVKLNVNSDNIESFKTICPRVVNRIPKLQNFVKSHDIIIFVSDPESSNGKMLFEVCKNNNQNSYFVTHTNDIKTEWFKKDVSVGISGATSTPLWLMQEIKNHIENLLDD